MEQQTATAIGVVIVAVSLVKRADMQMYRVNLPPAALGVTVYQIDPAGANRFHLGTTEFYPRFDLFDDFVVVVCFFIAGNYVHLPLKIVLQRSGGQRESSPVTVRNRHIKVSVREKYRALQSPARR